MAAIAQDLDRLSGDLQVIGSGTSALRRRLAKQKEQLQELRSALARIQDELNEISAGLRALQREPDDLRRAVHVHGCISPYLDTVGGLVWLPGMGSAETTSATAGKASEARQCAEEARSPMSDQRPQVRGVSQDTRELTEWAARSSRRDTSTGSGSTFAHLNNLVNAAASRFHFVPPIRCGFCSAMHRQVR
ncbi:hypothetical protein ACFU6K_08155 [Kitasatospora sp. NPDC057512]|uniref:hypothetical protein n=1 Tax=Kitasatospora sp. NPDC057512 TaxID=3346154 RepID=UPI0036CAD0B3